MTMYANINGVNVLLSPEEEADILASQAASQAASAAAAVVAGINSAFAALIAAGIVITSTATPALNATYSVDDVATANITALQTGIASGLPLPGGGSTFDYLDKSGIGHEFTAENFTNFAVAARDFVYAARIALATKLASGLSDWPSNEFIIA